MKYFLILATILQLYSCNNISNSDTRFNIAAELIRNGKLREADSLFNTIKYTNKIDFNYKLLQIIIEFKYSKFTESLAASQNFIKIYSTNSLGYYYAGLSEFNLHNFINSEIYFDLALTKLNKSSDKDFIYLKKSNNNSDFDEVSIYDDLQFMLGLSKRFLGKYNTAILYMEACLDRNYRKADAYLVIGDCYASLGDEVNSRQYFLLAKQNGNKDADKYLIK